MRSPIIRLLRKALSKFSLFEFVIPMTSVILGLGIVSESSIMIDTFSMIQMVLLITFLELGSQLFLFHQREYSDSARKGDIPGEKNAFLLLVILFYGMSILPFSQILQNPKASPTFLITLALSSFLIIIWRNIGESAFTQIMKIFIISFNNSFLLPLSQLVFYRLEVNTLFITISQVLFLFLLGFLIMREVINVEIKREKSGIVQIIGTIPLLKISEALLILGSTLFVIFGIRNPKVEIHLFSFFSIGLVLLTLIQTFQIDRVGKAGLITIYRTMTILLIFQFLGWLTLFWLF